MNIDDVSEVKEMAEVKGNYRVALCKFLCGLNTTKYYAFALFDNTVVEEDYVLCDTANGYSVTQVKEIVDKNDYNGVAVTKEVVCKVDFTDFNNRIEARKAKEKIKKQMDKLVKQNQELVLYQMLAKENPEMAAMLEEYKKLGDV